MFCREREARVDHSSELKCTVARLAADHCPRALAVNLDAKVIAQFATARAHGSAKQAHIHWRDLGWLNPKHLDSPLNWLPENVVLRRGPPAKVGRKCVEVVEVGRQNRSLHPESLDIPALHFGDKGHGRRVGISRVNIVLFADHHDCSGRASLHCGWLDNIGRDDDNWGDLRSRDRTLHGRLLARELRPKLIDLCLKVSDALLGSSKFGVGGRVAHSACRLVHVIICQWSLGKSGLGADDHAARKGKIQEQRGGSAHRGYPSEEMDDSSENQR